MSQRIGDLFVADVTRDIPPVVYFKDKAPHKLMAEVDEYIITGGWPDGHPNKKRVGDGIHEQYVRLLTQITADLGKPGGPSLPNAWISGFYGSGKSSFAKLLGFALDGVALPDGRSLSEAWLGRDTSPNASELRAAWAALRHKVDPIAVVFDVGGIAKDNDHIHTVAVRQLRERLGYCADPHVAALELSLENRGEWALFEARAREVLGHPWAQAAAGGFPEDDCSRVVSALWPERFPTVDSWFERRAGERHSLSPDEAVEAMGQMIEHRRRGATLFLVVDEVSQYVLSHPDRVDRMRAFASALGSILRGRAWLLALGQQSLDEQADKAFLTWARDRFPPHLRVHLAPTNIRDVVHKRLLQKRPAAETTLRELFGRHREALKLGAYDCMDITPDEFVEFYPMLPGHFPLLLRITSALRLRSRRAQGDDQAIRGLLQLLGELFRGQKLAEAPVGALVTLDQIYEVQHTALDADTQSSMARVLDHCSTADSALMLRAAKAVALLELIQDTDPTTAQLVAQCLCEHVERGSQTDAVTEALEALRRANLLGYSEKHGYKIQSSAGEEWERERREVGVSADAVSAMVQRSLVTLLSEPRKPQLRGRAFPWAGLYSDSLTATDVSLVDPRDDAVVRVDFRFLPRELCAEPAWVKRSDETALSDRLVWVVGDWSHLREVAGQLGRSQAMIRRYQPRRESLAHARKLLLQEEENRAEDLAAALTDAARAAWFTGRLYFRGRSIAPRDHGAAFATALLAAAERILPDLFPHFVVTQVQPSELLQLLEDKLVGPSAKFMGDDLGILSVDAGRHMPTCDGVVPRRVHEHIRSTGGLGGAALLARFGGPPYGHTAGVVKACVAGLLRAGAIRIEPEGGDEITAILDTGTRDLFEKERPFRRATFFPAADDEITLQTRARICKVLFKDLLGHNMDREDHLIADAVANHFPRLAGRLRRVAALFQRLPGRPELPPALVVLEGLLEKCVRQSRQAKPTVKLLERNLDALRDGISLLQHYDSELQDDVIDAVRAAHDVLTHQVTQLRERDALGPDTAAADAVAEHLATERPWRDIAALGPHLQALLAAYAAERRRLLNAQEDDVEAARDMIKRRNGFSTLSADDAHRVVGPLAQAATDTTELAVAPTLAALVDPFHVKLRRAVEEANAVLDKILSAGDKPLIVVVDLRLQHREVATEADVYAVVADIEAALLAEVHAGRRVRIK